ncbi:hypothetical protein TNCV_2771121 [Trichonephila clavipes]|nr:hypothetical protein TNCV_2771121 [Trichonephila clavipes]
MVKISHKGQILLLGGACKELLPAPGNRSNKRLDREEDLATTEEKKLGTRRRGSGKESRGGEKFVLARDPNNLEESINAALIEEQNVKLNQTANDERTGLSPLQTETSVISALTNKLEEINLRVERLQEASSVTSRKIGGGLFRRRETVRKCFYCGFEGHKQAECRKRRAEERTLNYQPPWGNAANEFSVFRQPNTHSFDQRRVHFHDSNFRDNYTVPRHSANVSQRTSRDRGDVTRFRRNTRNDNLNFRGESRF